MWIETTNEGLERRLNRALIPEDADHDVSDYDVSFNDNGTANVPEAVAEAYIEHYDDISPKGETN